MKRFRELAGFDIYIECGLDRLVVNADDFGFAFCSADEQPFQYGSDVEQKDQENASRFHLRRGLLGGFVQGAQNMEAKLNNQRFSPYRI